MDNLDNVISKYIASSADLLFEIAKNKNIITTVDIIINELVRCLKSPTGKVLFAGNGGSAADAQHMSGEYVSKFNFDRPGLSAVALTTDSSIITAIGNDYGYSKIFSRQIEAIGSKGDVICLYSTSGNSVNILEAIKQSKKIGIKTILFTGENVNSDCSIASEIVINIPSPVVPKIQECHAVLGHLICGEVEKIIFKDLK